MKFLHLSVLLAFAPLSSGLRCNECGILSIIPDNKDGDLCNIPNPNSYNPELNRTTVVDTCNIDLTSKAARFSSGISFNNVGYQDGETNSTMTEVCYTLQGIFRNEQLLMRGCDVILLDVGTQSKCLGNELKMWFDTERGREYIQVSSFCVCTSEDYCNFKEIYGASARQGPFVEAIMLISLMYFVNNFT